MNKEERDIFRNLVDFYKEIALISGYQTGEFYGIDYVWNTKGSWPAYLFGKPGKKQAEAVTGEIRERRLPPFWIMDDQNDQELIGFLDEKGIRPVRKWKGMVLNVKAFEKQSGPDDVKLRFNHSRDLPVWRALINEGLFTASRMGEEIEHTLNSGDQFTWSVARIEDKPVSAGLLFTFERIAGIYMIVTRNACRGRGIGTMVTGALIDRALDNGIDRIVLHATPMGEGIYRNLGFEPVNELSIYWKLGY